MSRTIALLALLLVAGTIVAPSGVAPVSGPPTFSLNLIEGPISIGEPSIMLDTSVSPATAWVTGPANGVWRSTNGASSWQKQVPSVLEDPEGVWTNGDASLAIDADGVLYLSGMTDEGQLTSTVPVQVSLDRGASWTRFQQLLPNANGIECDRQWTDARGHGEAVTTIRCGDVGVLWRTTDAGVSWQGPFTIATNVAQMGPIHYSPDGNLYVPYWDFDFVRIARSSDGGLTWMSFPVAPVLDTRSFTVSAADSAGNLYYVFDQSMSVTGIEPAIKSRIFISTSMDDGATWSSPKQLSDVRFTGIFPWVVAKAPGKVAVSFYSAQTSGNPSADLGPSDLGGPTTTWDVVLAQSVNALSLAPTYQRVTVVDDFHTGSICTSGLSCVGPQNLLGAGNVPTPFDRRFLDYFEMRVDAAGDLWIVYGNDRPMTNCLDSCAVGDLVLSWVDLKVAKQTGGTNLS